MSNPEFKEALNTVTCRVLEQIAFVFPEPADLTAGIVFEDQKMLSVSLSFSGIEHGELSLIIPEEFCLELYANFLGKETQNGISEEEYTDAAKETLNIITGQFLTEIFGDEEQFNLSAPKAEKISKDELFSRIESGIYACSMVEDYPLIVILKLEAKVYGR